METARQATYDRNTVSLLVSATSGLVSTAIASFVSASWFISSTDFGPVSIYKGGLLSADALISLAFSVIAIAFLSLSGRMSISPALFVFAGVLRIALLVCTLSVFWDPGWYYILDPNGAHPAGISVIAFSAVQGIALGTAFSKK